MPHPPCVDALLTGAHRPEMDKAKIGIIPTTGNPATHSAQMTIDTVPHDFPYETADFLETIYAIKLCHPKRRIIAVALINQVAVLSDIRFSAACGDSGI